MRHRSKRVIVAEQDKVFAKCAWRLIPFMMLLYVVSFIDPDERRFRRADDEQGPRVLALGLWSRRRFVLHHVQPVPGSSHHSPQAPWRPAGDLLDHARVGAARGGNAFVRGMHSFFALRLLLGVAEAGFFPGMIFYLTLWFPQAYRGRFSGTFATGHPARGNHWWAALRSPLGMDGVSGMHGWQWMFLLEGLPATVLAFAVLKFLPDGPMQATWLDDAEKSIIVASLTPETVIRDRGLWRALADARVWALGSRGVL